MPDARFTDSHSPRPSACPGLLRIVPALDGGICRVKLPGGVLRADQARIIASAATRCASGVLELTNRSNLQMRGVRDDQAQALIAALLAAGLGPRHPDADDVRNVLISPAAGLDPAAHLDMRPLAARLLERLQDEAAFRALSPKFAVQLDGGESLAMRAHPHDLWLAAVDRQRLLFGLAGCPLENPLGSVPAHQALALVEAVLHLFLDNAEPGQARMRQWLGERPAGDVLDRLRERLDVAVAPAVPVPTRPIAVAAPLGTHRQRQPGLCMLLAAAPLGRLRAEALARLAALADDFGSGHLHLTPWQGVLLPNVAEGRVAPLRAELAALGLLLDSGAPLARLVACTGAEACAKGLAATKADALRLAERLPAGHGPQIHLSGCSRACAAAHVAPYTLLARPDGRYQLYQRAAGATGFGRLLADALTLDDAGDWFAAPGNAP